MDVGGESTRPGAAGVSVDEELRRVVPVLELLDGVPVSIDTAKSEVARRALELGAELVNDVTALRGDARSRRRRRRERCVPLPDAHAGRAAHDAGRSSLRRRRVGSGRVPRGAAGVRCRGRDPGGAHLPRSRDRLRQDRRPELRARPAAGRARRAWAPGADRALAQELARTPLRSRGAHRLACGLARRSGCRLRARRLDLPGPRRARARRGARRRRGRSHDDRADGTAHPRLPRRARLGARARAELPLRHRARGRRGRQLGQARGCGRLPGCRRLREGGLGRRAPTTCSRRSRPQSPTSWWRASRSRESPSACASPTSCSIRPSRSRQCASRARDASRTSASAPTSETATRRSARRSQSFPVSSASRPCARRIRSASPTSRAS